MIGISKLYCGTVEPSDALRYKRRSAALPSHLLQFSADKKPVIVWNVTWRCNLACRHCYSGSGSGDDRPELDTVQAKAVLEDLAAFGSPVVLFSGGEPLMRPDLPELARYAVQLGLRAVISTNGTLITPETAEILKDIGLSYVGVSLDGIGATNDRFRGVAGAYEAALAGVRACRAAGLKVGLRYTLTKATLPDLPRIFDLLEQEKIPRACFYHLVYSGRGAAIRADDLTHAETRTTVDQIIDRTADLFSRGLRKEILTVDNHADGPYVYLRMVREGNPRAEGVLELLRMNGGNSSGHGIGCISWDGTVYPDQFWRTRPVGTVASRPFSEIWQDRSLQLLRELREKPAHVTGKCRTCRFLAMCGGNLRARGEAATGETWGVDPACYLSAAEIAEQ